MEYFPLSLQVQMLIIKVGFTKIILKHQLVMKETEIELHWTFQATQIVKPVNLEVNMLHGIHED